MVNILRASRLDVNLNRSVKSACIELMCFRFNRSMIIFDAFGLNEARANDEKWDREQSRARKTAFGFTEVDATCNEFVHASGGGSSNENGWPWTPCNSVAKPLTLTQQLRRRRNHGFFFVTFFVCMRLWSRLFVFVVFDVFVANKSMPKATNSPNTRTAHMMNSFVRKKKKKKNAKMRRWNVTPFLSCVWIDAVAAATTKWWRVKKRTMWHVRMWFPFICKCTNWMTMKFIRKTTAAHEYPNSSMAVIRFRLLCARIPLKSMRMRTLLQIACIVANTKRKEPASHLPLPLPFSIDLLCQCSGSICYYLI